MKNNTDIETKAAQTAFCWLEYKYYGSESNAIKSLLKRKGTEHLSPDAATALLSDAVKVFERTKELRETTIRTSSIASLTQDQFEEYRGQIEETLKQEFPGLEAIIDYMVGMLLNMRYWR